MKKTLLIAALAILGLARQTAASPYYSNSFDGSSTTLTMMGRFAVSGSTAASSGLLNVDGPKGIFSWNYGIQAATASLTGTGASVYSLSTSSGINVSAGMVSASGGFVGPFYGNANTATAASNLSGGVIGKLPVQSAANTTSFLPAMANGGLIIGAGVSAIPSTGTLTGNAAVVVTNSAGGIAFSLDSTSATLRGNTFNGASQLVQMGSDNKLPAIDGSNLTNIGGTLSGGTTGKSAFWTSANSLIGGPASVTSSSDTYLSGTTLNISTGATFALYGTVLAGNNGPLHHMSSTTVTGTSTSANFGVCLATVTYFSNGNAVHITFDGVVDNASTPTMGVSFLKDGGFVNGGSVTKAFGSLRYQVGGEPESLHMDVTVAATAGTHNYCVTFNTGGGTINVPATKGANAEFRLEELQ